MRCPICRCGGVSQKTWQHHASGKRHRKNGGSPSDPPPTDGDAVPQPRATLPARARDPLVSMSHGRSFDECLRTRGGVLDSDEEAELEIDEEFQEFNRFLFEDAEAEAEMFA